ncbi:MAG TPA: UDP-3-O-(3-hydroxymyristoyl)glucosamine N-acyltransferase [Steroidobacteraceae bacterium]|jgi:UDP-3-O-[3-hydroxymyristoyl] glucosamine N-acyltransferase|nr:UDP-3-O-(3-hydroxymyristoyl)glucosamine N-acyltransferase [Steroidobacteraceae bacterium]
MLSAQAIKNQHSDIFTFLHGNLETAATHCHVPEEALAQSLVYVTDAAQLSEARRHKPAILIVHANMADRLCAVVDAQSCCFSVKNISMGMAILLKYFDGKAERFTQWGERHPTAVVHADALIGRGVCLGPYCVIGAGANIGDGCMIGSHAVVENAAKIGARSILHPHVFIGSRCQVGTDCEIHPHTSIGSDGFGYAVDADGTPRKISHLGNVVIGNGVEIGSNCAIDRATLTSTYIRSGTKLDNICHIAHNCDLGENGFFTAGFMMGGSTKIGRRFVTGGNSVVTAHITVGDNVVLSGRSSVTNDVPNAGAYGGYPLQPLKEALRTAVSIGHLNEIRRNLKRVMKHLHLSENPQDDAAES